VVLFKKVSKNNSSGSILLLVLSLMLIATSLVTVFIKSVISEITYNSQLKEPIDLKIKAYSYMDLVIATLDQLKKEWGGGLLFTRGWLRGYEEIPVSEGKKGNYVLKKYALNNYLMQTITQRAGIPNSDFIKEKLSNVEGENGSIIQQHEYITGIKDGDMTIKITVEDETGKLPLCAEFYKKLTGEKSGKVENIYAGIISRCVLAKGLQNKNIKAIIETILASQLQVRSLEHFAKLFQEEWCKVKGNENKFFDENGIETSYFAELRKYFTIIPNLGKDVNNFKINILTAASIIIDGNTIVGPQSSEPNTGLLCAGSNEYSDNFYSHNDFRDEWLYEVKIIRSARSKDNNALINARKNPQQYSKYKEAIVQKSAEANNRDKSFPRGRFKNFIGIDATHLKITIKVSKSTADEFTLVALVNSIPANKSKGRFETFDILSISET
jgi:hypothetical protein